MKNMYFNLKQLPSKNDGGQSCDGNRQSRLMSQSGCGAVDVPMTSYGASDEHLMSIRSASDGERWKNRGWKYVACMLMVLFMGVGNVCGESVTFRPWAIKTTPTKIGKVTPICATGVSTGKQFYKVGSTAYKDSTVAISSSADTAVIVPQNNKCIQFTIDDGYQIDSFSVRTVSNSTTTGSTAVVAWKGAKSYNPDSIFLISLAGNDGSVDPWVNNVHVPNGTKTIGFYSRIKVDNATTPTKIKTSSGNNYPSSGVSQHMGAIIIYYSVTSGGGGGCTSHSVSLSSSGSVTGGTFATSSATVCEGETATLTATPAAGYEFTSWSASGTGGHSLSSTTTNPATLTMGTADVTVNATFSLKNYTVTLNNQSATSAGTENVTTTYNSNTNLTSAITKPTKTGYVFAGYFTAANGGGVQLIDPAGNWIASAGGGSTYLDGSKNWKNDGNLTLYACWMEYCPGMDMAAQAISLGSGEHKTWTGLTTNKILYSVAGNTTFDDSSDASNAYDGLKFKNNGDYILFLVQANSSLKLYFGYTDTKPKISINGGAESNVNVTSTQSKTPNQEVDFGTQTYDRLIKLRTVTSNTVVLQKIEITAPAGCSGYSFHWGIKDEDGWEQDCFEYSGSDDVHWVNSFTIPAAEVATHFYVGKFGSFYETGGLGNNNAKSYTNPWMYMPFTTSQGNGSGTRPMVGQAEGATGKIRIADNSTWDNLFVSFLPDGYKLKFGSTEKAFAVEAGNEYRSELVEYNSSTADDAVSVGIIDSEGGYVSTDNTQEMRHLFLNTGGTSLWSADGRVNFGIYSVTSSSWVCLMAKVPGEDYLYEGWVPTTCETVIFARLNASTLSWDNRDNQTENITLASDKNLYTITGWANTDYSVSAYEKKGKFRMNADYTDKNWYVRFYPYHVLTYNANGGSGAPSAQGVPVDGNAAARTVDVAAGSGMTAPTGYEFAGWNPDKSEADAGTIDGDYDPEDEVTMSEDVTLYAVWSPIEYTITLAKGDHGAANQSATVDYDATAVTSITHVTSTGYTLQGYYDGETKVLNADGTFAGSSISGYITSSKWSLADNCTLTAKWSAKTTTVTLNANTDNHGDGDNQTVTATYDSALPSFTHTTAETGYHLVGYYTGETSGDKIINADGTFNANSGIWNRTDGATLTLYAHYEINTYTVTFVSNNDGYGTVDVASISGVTHGSTVAIEDNVLTLKETDVTATAEDATAEYTYAFDGWSVDDDDAITSATEITATFTRTANSYTLGWSKNGSGDALSGSYTSGSTAYGTTLTAPDDPTWDGYRFTGWNTADDGKGDDYTGTMPAANTTYYAQWEEIDCPTAGTMFSLTMLSKVTSSDKTLSAPDSIDLGKDSYATVSGGKASFINYDTSTGRGKITKDNPNKLQFNNNNNVALRLDFDCALQTGDSIILSGVSGCNMSFTTTTTRSAADSTSVIDGKCCFIVPAKFDGATKLYGWRSRGTSLYITGLKVTRPEAGYTITHNDPTGSGTYTIKVGSGAATGTSTSAHEDDVITLAATPGTGYSFTSWTVTGATSGDDITVSENQFTMPAENVTVDATFTIIDYTVTLNTNSGTINSGNVTSYNYGTGATLPTDVTRSGYRFMGWYADDEFDGDRVYTIANNVTGDKEYWAKWAQLYTITKGSPSNGTITVAASAIEGETVDITATPSTGYSFSAWSIYKTSDAETTITPAAATATTSFTMPAYGVTVDASFAAVTYSLSYEKGAKATGAASGGTSAGSYAEGTTITTPAKGTLDSTGCTFRGWTDGTTFYLAGQSFSMPASNVTLTAVWDAGGGKDCSWGLWWFYKEDDRTASGFAENNLSLFSQGTSNAFSAVTYNGLTGSARTGNSTPSSKSFTIPSGKTGQLYFIGKGGSSRTIQLKQSSTVKYSVEPGSSEGSTCMIDDIAEGTYEITSSGNIAWSVVAIKFCSSGGSSGSTVAFANMTGFAGSATLPDTIKGVPSGKKILQPSNPTASGYEFSGWYSDAACTAGNEINWSTMTITADKTIYAKWCAPHTITWVVNGATYTAGTPTTETTDCDGITTMPTAPADNTLSGCANSFRGWSETNLYGAATTKQPADLFVTAANAPAINADKTFYAVFGTATDKALVGTVMWSEDWTGATTASSASDDAAPSGQGSHSGQVVYSGSVTYTETSNGTYVSNQNTGGGVAPELMIKASEAWTIAGIPSGGADSLILLYTRNDNTLTPTVSGEGYAISSKVSGSGAGTYVYYIKCGSGSTFSLTFTAGSKNVRVDDIVVKVKRDGATNYRCICPSLSVTPKLVTANTPIFITSAASKTVRSQDSLRIVGGGLAKNATLSISSPASKFALKSGKNGTLTTDATGAIDTVAYIYYTPAVGDTDDGLDKNNSFTISDGTNTETVSQALIGRHLPANFVIAAKSGDKWYALPANNAKGKPSPVEITVNNSTTPDTATTSEANVYTLYQQTSTVMNNGNGQYVKLAMHGQDNAPLFGGKSDNELGKSGSGKVTSDLSEPNWWYFKQTNTSITSAKDATYYLHTANTANPVTLYNDATNWGLYASGAKNVQEIRLLTWTCANPAAPTISGETEYTEGETITLEASHDGSNHDAMTSYTWYKGADWAAASAASPVKAAALGSSGYTLTIDDCDADDAGTYWCEASNGTCSSHNSVGYAITVNAPCFKFQAGTTKAGSGWDVADDGAITTDLWTDGSQVLTGGTLKNTSGSALGGNASYGLVFAASGSKQVTLTLAKGSNFAVGTVISITGYSNNSTDACGFTINGNDMSPATYTPGSESYTKFVQTYTVSASDGVDGESSITIDAATTIRVYLNAIRITNCGEVDLYDISTSATNGSIAVTVGGESASSAEEGATVTITATPDNGYSFSSWTVTDEDEGSVDVTSSTTNPTTFTMPAKDVTVDATFTPNTYTITYHLNGASWASSAGVASYTVGTGATLPLVGAMTNVGYTFDGWYANSDLSTGGVVTSISTSDYGNKEYWAKWTENSYTITYDANGGTGSTSATEGHYVTVADNGFTAPSGDAFVEWNTLSTGLGVSYNEGDEIELTANMTLYAIWAKTVGTINWTVTKIDSKLYRGGGGYTIKAEIDDASWDASAADSSKLELTASDGVVLRNIARSINASGKAQITAKFDITTDVIANAKKISFTLNVPKNNGYAPKNDDHNENLDNCTGGKVEVRFTSSNKNDEGDNFADMSEKSNTIQYVGDGLAKLIATNDCKISASAGNDGYRLDRCAVVFKFAGTTALDVYYTAGSSSRSFALYSFSSANDLEDITTSDYGTKSVVTSVTGVKAAFANTSATSSNPSISTGVVATSGSGGGIIATYSSLSAGYYVLLAVSGEGYLYGFDVSDGGSGGEPVSPTLTWTPALNTDGDWDSGNSRLNKETGDADFTFTVTQDVNSLGAITYASSNTSVATVNSTTGKVHIVGAGSATITATMAESGCYDEATATYNIAVVDNCDDVPGKIETTDLGCSGTQMTVSGHTGEGAGATYQWYKDGASIGGATSATYTATAAGEYYVVVTNTGHGHCAMTSTNTIVVEALSGKQAKRLQTEWYVKNGRRTPDIALVQTGNAKKFIVKNGETVLWDSSDEDKRTGFGGCGFYLGDDEIIYLKGTQDDGSAPSGLTGSTDVTLTIKTVYCDDAEKDNSVTIHCQAATSYKEVAFVVDGTEGGNWNAVTSGHADGTALYEYLDTIGTAASARKFQLTERNIYKTVDDSVLREHYSQFDAILITDNPSTDKMSGKKSYVDAFGTLIDIRPILTMEAYVSKLSNWKAKGINGNPSSPNPRQYGMKLECKNHEIFAGLNESSSNIKTQTVDGVTYWTVLMVDSTKSPYTGVAYNVDTKGDQKPALQGFSASDVSGLMLLGQISNGTLFAGVERQDEPAARLLLLGVNAKALPNALTPEGKRVIANALSYLCKTNMEDVDDCSTYFTGKAGTTDWGTAGNWSKDAVPNSPMLKVRILKPCVVPTGTKVRISHLDIVVGGKSKEIDGTPNGSLTIPASSAVVVAGIVNRVKAPYYGLDDLMPTETEDLKIEADQYHTGALIFNNEKGDTKATVEMYSPSYWEVDNVTGKKKKYWSYVGVPIQEVDIPNYFYLGFTYLYDETSGWTKKGDGSELHPFEGIGLSMQSGHKETFYGTLASTETREITLTKTAEGGNGENLIGNSWTAPIQIANFDATDFGEATATVYVYNTGKDVTEGDAYGGTGSTTPGQWVSVPVETAKDGAYDGLKVIPAMNAFQVNTESETTLTLDYNKLVRKGASTNDLNDPMRAPRRQAAGTELEAMMRVRVSGTKTHTDVWLQQDSRFTDAFDNGWEAKYAECDNRSAQLYAQSEIGNMAFLALPDLEGTILGFAPSRDGNEYTFTFHYAGEDEFYLNDLKLVRSALISEVGSYTFTYEEGDTNRFYISRTRIDAPQMPTGVENTHEGVVKAHKFIYNDKLYILFNGRVYSADGQMVK